MHACLRPATLWAGLAGLSMLGTLAPAVAAPGIEVAAGVSTTTDREFTRVASVAWLPGLRRLDKALLRAELGVVHVEGRGEIGGRDLAEDVWVGFVGLRYERTDNGLSLGGAIGASSGRTGKPVATGMAWNGSETDGACCGTGAEGGIHDARTQNAKVVATHCTIMNNSPYNAYDADSTAVMDAENCYWGSSSGPGATVYTETPTANLDATPYLSRPYIGWLIGGSPAGVTALGVKESTAAPDYANQLHLIANSNYAVAWTFASDFEGQSQSAYQIEIDDSADFGSLVHTGTKTTSASDNIQIATSLTDGTLYYLRVRLWDANDRAGPWYYSVFRLNDEPGTVATPTVSTSVRASATSSVGPPRRKSSRGNGPPTRTKTRFILRSWLRTALRPTP